jgi:Zn-dependent protease
LIFRNPRFIRLAAKAARARLSTPFYRTCLAGIPVRVHWSVLLAVPALWYFWRAWDEAVVGFAAYLALLLAHEWGHAVQARRLGLRVHFIEVYVLHGGCAHDCAESRHEDAMVAWGGVVAQALVLMPAVSALLLGRLLFHPLPVLMEAALGVLIPYNLLLIACNLLPIEGVDGQRAWKSVPALGQAARTWMERIRRGQTTEDKLSAHRVTAELLDRLRRREKD